MIKFALFLFIFCSALRAACPIDSVYLALGDQIRGYPLSADSTTAPCQVIAGRRTGLATARALAISKDNFFHTAQFLTNSMFEVFAPFATANFAPERTVQLPENDLSGIAIDSKINDFVLSIREEIRPILVVPNAFAGSSVNPTIIVDPNLAFAYSSIAVDTSDDLLVAGYDRQTGRVRIDTLGTSRSLMGAPLLRSLTGPRTGLLGRSGFASNNVNITLDPTTQDLYVYNTNGIDIQVSIFARGASGDAVPIRVIRGSMTQIGGPGFIGAGKIGVSADGRLFVAEAPATILVFAAGADGNVAPVQVMSDPTVGSSGANSGSQGGIAVRSRHYR